MANRCSMSFNFNISYHRHQGLLECQTFVTNHALFNASHSTYLILAQWRLVLSESAVPYVYVSYVINYYRDNVHYLLSHCTTRYMNYFTCDVKLELQENCAINAPSGKSFETAVIVILFAISGFTSNDRAPGGPVTITILIFKDHPTSLGQFKIFNSLRLNTQYEITFFF